MDTFIRLLFPAALGVAEQCSRLRGFGEHCLSEASCAAAGVGEPRRGPGGPRTGGNGFGSFCRNKRTY
jgi:hypothetical protein